MARRKLYPMPVQEVFDHPAYVALPAAGRGMLLSALETYWRSECRALPQNDDGLFAVVRAHRSTWRKHKPDILLVFNDVRPALEAYYRLRVTKSTTISFLQKRGGATTAAKAKLKTMQEDAPRSPDPTQTAPVKERQSTPRRANTLLGSLMQDAA